MIARKSNIERLVNEETRARSPFCWVTGGFVKTDLKNLINKLSAVPRL